MRRLVTVTDVDTGIVVSEKHYLNGKLHRDAKEGPAYIKRWLPTGLVVHEICYWHGLKHRDNGPAEIQRQPRELLDKEELGQCDGDSYEVAVEYYKHGREHRDPKEGPSSIERYSPKIVCKEVYTWDGAAYRDPADGPCVIERHPDGEIMDEIWSAPHERPQSYERYLASKKLLKPAS